MMKSFMCGICAFLFVMVDILHHGFGATLAIYAIAIALFILYRIFFGKVEDAPRKPSAYVSYPTIWAKNQTMKRLIQASPQGRVYLDELCAQWPGCQFNEFSFTDYEFDLHYERRRWHRPRPYFTLRPESEWSLPPLNDYPTPRAYIL
jgi:hypothetical protein